MAHNGVYKDRKGIKSRVDLARDAGGFTALPHVVFDCPAYVALGYPARCLLGEIARQYNGKNNGQLLASKSHLAARGWTSADVLHRAKQELLKAGFIYETVKGHRPNKASWYALTWYALNRHSGFDAGAVESFRRGAYRENATLSPARGPGRCGIGPRAGAATPISVPARGPMKATFDTTPVP